MSNTEQLADFFADTDIDSLRELGLANHNIDISGVYCQHTGRKVGTFDDFVIQFAIDDESTDDDEALVDALVTRVVCSMRPSPMFNKPDRVTLSNMASKFPVDVLSYLVNRLHSNRHSAVNRPNSESVFQPYFDKIATHQKWTALVSAGVDPLPWIHWLLELDAKRNLHDIPAIRVEQDSAGKWKEGKAGESLFKLLTQANLAELMAVFESWTWARIAEFDSRDREAVAQDKWMRGNTMSQTAFARSWLENPIFASKKAEASHKAKNSPPRVVSEKTSKLNEKVKKFLHLLDDIMDSGGEVELMTQTKKIPVARTGAMLFAKKESL